MLEDIVAVQVVNPLIIVDMLASTWELAVVA
jgi:hypothetical protein